jgi:hypothetical protein
VSVHRVEENFRHPSDAMRALAGVRALPRDGREPRAVGKTVRAISKTLARRTGVAKAQVMALHEQAGRLIARSAREAQRLAAQPASTGAAVAPAPAPSYKRLQSSDSSPSAATRSRSRSIAASAA